MLVGVDAPMRTSFRLRVEDEADVVGPFAIRGSIGAIIPLGDTKGSSRVIGLEM